MSDIAIRAENLGKMYQIGSIQERKDNFREVIADAVSAPVRRARSLLRGQAYGAAELDQTIWALKDLSFEVKHGEVIGIIGRNGAGKSTLLKILSRITEPSAGYVDVYGRVGALLEVGTGFHQELTGRENVYLNGAILGMGSKEIDKKFDEIVDFAGVEKFIDTPVKHYSSGMRLRLGFAVAAHLEPDILVVDEVLAVGDAEFQKRCLGKMSDVAGEGRTVLFVSHNMEAVINLCQRSYVLKDGHIVFNGETHSAVEYYMNSVISHNNNDLASHLLFSNRKQRSNCVTAIEVLDSEKQPKSVVSTWDSVVFRIHYNLEQSQRNGSIVLDIQNSGNQRLIVMDSGLKHPLNCGNNYIDCHIPRLPLASGDFYLSVGLAISRTEWIWREQEIALLRIQGKDVFDLSRPPTVSRMLFALEHTWQAP